MKRKLRVVKVNETDVGVAVFGIGLGLCHIVGRALGQDALIAQIQQLGYQFLLDIATTIDKV